MQDLTFKTMSIKIRIVRADDDRWHRKLVGKVRIAKEIRGDVFILRNYRTILRTIPIKDCAIEL